MKLLTKFCPNVIAAFIYYYPGLTLSLTHFMPLGFFYTLWFSDVFRGYRKKPVAWNGLIAPNVDGEYLTNKINLVLLDSLSLINFVL